MKLCDKYSEIVISDKRKLIKVVGDTTYTKIYLILNNGVNIDPKDKLGISHLCEHIFIESVSSKYTEKVRDSYFQSMGFTNYEHTVLTFSISSNQGNVECLIDILSELINGHYLKSEYIQKCKMDVIRECNIKQKESEYSLKINKFITDDNINYLPIGDSYKIIHIGKEDIKAFLPQYYDSFSLVIFHHKDINVEISEKLVPNKTIFQNSFKTYCCQNTKEKTSKVLNIQSDYQKNLRIYFKQTKSDYTFKEKVAQCLIEIIINYKICSYLHIKNEQYIPIVFRRKVINDDYSFIVMCMDGYEKNLKDNFVGYLLDIPISKEDFIQSKDTFILFLNETIDIDDTYVFNSIFHYLIYNEAPSITEEQINQLRRIMKEITLDDIIKLKEEIFTNDYKVVISY